MREKERERYMFKGQLSVFFLNFPSKSLKDNYSGWGWGRGSKNKTRKAATKRKQVEI